MSISLMTVFSGWDGYQRSLVSAIEGLTEENLLYRPAPERRSIGEIAGHIAYGRMDWFHRMGAPGSADLAQRIKPFYQANSILKGEVNQDSAALVHWLEESWRMIEGALLGWTPDDLATSFKYVYWGKTYSISYQWVIWRIMAHDVHHGGQLSMLLAAQGIEPQDLGDNGGHTIEPPIEKE